VAAVADHDEVGLVRQARPDAIDGGDERVAGIRGIAAIKDGAIAEDEQRRGAQAGRGDIASKRAVDVHAGTAAGVVLAELHRCGAAH
jgi:hypothetical protein